ncbi:hypothetical protein ACBR37_29150 [Streptomyces sp. AD55]
MDQAGPREPGVIHTTGRPAGEHRMFDAFRGPRWTLLPLGVPAPDGVPAPVRVVRGPAHGAYGTGLFLVRPDGYVGWAGPGPDGPGARLARSGVR